ncbi:MAG: flagellar biosynthetic protein FliO [Gammaproteobacteria bacterium]
MHHLRLVTAVLALAPAASLAAAPEPLASGQALRVLIGLGLVLALIAAASWAVRRVHGIGPRSGGHIRVVEGLSVGTREKLLLVEVDGERVLLGMCPGRIQTLATLGAGTVEPSSPAAAFDQALAASVQEQHA